jgi:hypothetical protein
MAQMMKQCGLDGPSDGGEDAAYKKMLKELGMTEDECKNDDDKLLAQMLAGGEDEDPDNMTDD